MNKYRGRQRLYALNTGKYFTFEVSTQTRHVMTPEELGKPRKPTQRNKKTAARERFSSA